MGHINLNLQYINRLLAVCFLFKYLVSRTKGLYVSRVSSENRLGRMVCYIPLKFWWGPPVLTRKDKRSADLIKGVQTVYLIRLLESVNAKRPQCLSIIMSMEWTQKKM